MDKLKYTISEITDESGSKVYSFLLNDAIYKHVEKHGSWEPYFATIVSELLKEGDECIDLGANFGYHTITMANLVGEAGRVYAFEPIRIIFQQLNCNIFLNGLTNTFSYNLAVGLEIGKTKIPKINFFEEVTNYGDTSIDFSNEGEDIDVTNIDSYDFKNLKFIKMDVQGSELPCISGAYQTIEKHKPVIFLEIEEFRFSKFGYDVNDLISTLKNKLEYKIYRIETDYPVDHLCVHKDYIMPEFKSNIRLTEV